MTRVTPAASNHANAAGVDCVMAFDMLAAASDSHREGAVAGRTVVIGSLEVVPTGRMVTHPESTFYPTDGSLRARLDEVSRPELNRYLDAAAICRGIFGSTTAANILVLGVAVQAGALPIDPANIERAIELNGVAVQQNLAAFRFGRQWAVDPTVIESAAQLEVRTPETLDQLIARLATDLADYQDADYAKRFRDTIDEVRTAERRLVPGSQALTETAARNLHKLMAYKDEYEVARLALLPESQAAVRVDRWPEDEGHVPPPPADAAIARSRPQARVPAHRQAVVHRTAGDEAAAGHARRPVPLGRGAQARTGDDPRVREGARRTHRWPRRAPTSATPSRSPSSPIRCGATSTSSSTGPSGIAPNWRAA